MIARLTGTILEKRANAVVCDVGGVGYLVFVPVRDVGGVRVGDRAAFHIHHHISETASDLYGFQDESSLAMFRELIKISNVGPRTALAILSLRSRDEITKAVMANDPAMLAGIPGVGKKTVERILVELKDKLGESPAMTAGAATVESDVFNALVNLGYGRDEALSALQRIPSTATTIEEKVKESLKILGR